MQTDSVHGTFKMQLESQALGFVPDSFSPYKCKEVETNHACLSVGTRWERNETICVVMKLHESACHDPVTNRVKLNVIPVYSKRRSAEICALELIKFTWKL